MTSDVIISGPFDLSPQNLKAVEQGIYDAKLSGIVPQKQDATTIKIPYPKCVLDHCQLLVLIFWSGQP